MGLMQTVLRWLTEIRRNHHSHVQSSEFEASAELWVSVTGNGGYSNSHDENDTINSAQGIHLCTGTSESLEEIPVSQPGGDKSGRYPKHRRAAASAPVWIIHAALSCTLVLDAQTAQTPRGPTDPQHWTRFWGSEDRALLTHTVHWKHTVSPSQGVM